MAAEVLVNAALRARLQVARWTHWQPFRIALRDPRKTQAEVLGEILARNQSTRFGRDHRFGRLAGHRDFAAEVPVQTYETLRPLIEEQEATGAPVLNAERPLMYAQTSGTTGQPKLIPILPDTLTRHAHSQVIQVYRQYVSAAPAYRGKLLLIASPAVEGHLGSGTPFGSASGHVYRNMPALTRHKYVLPPEVLAIHDYELKYLTILRLALAHPDITFAGSANPSTFLKLHSVLLDHRDALLGDLSHGAFRHLRDLEPGVRKALIPALPCSAQRASELESVLSTGKPDFGQIWPQLHLLTTWTGGGCAIALSALESLLAPGTRICELGYLASEFRGTITVDLERNLGVPTIHENFFEFVERDDWHGGNPEFLTVEQLESGREYYVVVTTRAGLYRYFINDLVTVSGRFEATPALQFLRKGKGATNITGEKLYENQVIHALRAAEETLGLVSRFIVVLADAAASAYRLVIEWPDDTTSSPGSMRESVERQLAELNVEYAEKRRSGRLRELEIIPVRPGTGDAYKQDCLRQGQRESQFKVQVLQSVDDCRFPFEDYRIGQPQ